MSERLNELIGTKYVVAPYSSLPKSHQMSIAWFMAIETKAWFIGSNVNQPPFLPQLQNLLPQLISRYGDDLFGLINIRQDVLRKSILHDEDVYEHFHRWDDYHEWFVSREYIPAHPAHAKWPVILSSDDKETLADGIHRFHSYVIQGAKIIPSVFLPDVGHIADYELKTGREVSKRNVS